MKARGLTREQVMNDVLLAAQPTKQFVTPEQVAALAVFLLLEEFLSELTEHWRMIFGPLLVMIVIFGRGGIMGFLRPRRHA